MRCNICRHDSLDPEFCDFCASPFEGKESPHDKFPLQNEYWGEAVRSPRAWDIIGQQKFSGTTLFHVAPFKSRRSIQQYGLNWEFGNNFPYMYDDSIGSQPRAIYLFDNYDGAHWWAINFEGDKDNDIWAVDASGLNLKKDSLMYQKAAWYTYDVIPPDHLSLVNMVPSVDYYNPPPRTEYFYQNPFEQYAKTADFGDTNFRDNNFDQIQGDPKFDLDPLYNGLNIASDDLRALAEMHPNLTHEQLLDLLRRHKDHHNFDQEPENHTMYMFDKSVNTYMSSWKCPNCQQHFIPWKNDECIVCGHKGITDGDTFPNVTEMPAMYNEQYMMNLHQSSNEIVQEEIPPDMLEGYKNLFQGIPIRFAIYGDPYETKHPYFQTPGLISFLDFFVNDGRIYIGFINTNREYEGQGYARQLLDHLYQSYPDYRIIWGKSMDDAIDYLKGDFWERFPDRTTNQVADTDSPSRFIHIDREDLHKRTPNNLEYLKCRACEGLGHIISPSIVCPKCHGSGQDQTIKEADADPRFVEIWQEKYPQEQNIPGLFEELKSLFNATPEEFDLWFYNANPVVGGMADLIRSFVSWRQNRKGSVTPYKPLSAPPSNKTYKVSDITQDPIADDTTYHTDLHGWTDPTLHDLRERDPEPEFAKWADEGGNVAFIYVNGKIYWGKSVQDIIVQQLSHEYDIYTKPSLTGSFNTETSAVKYDGDPDKELVKSFSFLLRKELIPPDTKPYRPNQDNLRSNDEIYDVKMH